MLLKRGVEAVHVHFEPSFLCKLRRHLYGETVGVVKLESGVAGYGVADEVFAYRFELLHAGGYRLFEPALFGVNLAYHAVGVAFQLGIHVLIHVYDDAGDLRKQSHAAAQLFDETHGAAEQTAQDISLIDVGAQHAAVVAYYHDGGADMVGDDAYGLGSSFGRAVFHARKLLDPGDDGSEQVGFVHAVNALKRLYGAFQSHAGIDVLLREGFVFAVGCLVVLHEHVVPHFEILAARARRRTLGRARGLAGIDEHFGVRSARAGYARGSPPVIFLGQEEYAFFGYARLFPVRRGFVVARAVAVAGEHGHRQFSGVDAEILLVGQELVAPRDHFLFEIIAERPVAQHFEESQVRRVAHFVDIARAHALLHVGKAFALRVLLAEQIGHERVHARRREQHGRVVFGDKGRGTYYRVAFALVKIEPHPAQLRRVDLFHILPR